MVDFYTSRDATDMMAFVLDCHPEVARIRQLNPELSAVNDAPGIKYFRLGDSMKQTSHDVLSTGQEDRETVTDRESMQGSEQQARPLSLEETRRKASENWRRNYHDKRTNEHGAQADLAPSEEGTDKEKKQPERDSGPDFDRER